MIENILRAKGGANIVELIEINIGLFNTLFLDISSASISTNTHTVMKLFKLSPAISIIVINFLANILLLPINQPE